MAHIQYSGSPPTALYARFLLFVILVALHRCSSTSIFIHLHVYTLPTVQSVQKTTELQKRTTQLAAITEGHRAKKIADKTEIQTFAG
jgi:hypothetical protein